MSDTERAALDIAREISLEEQRDDLRAQLEAVTRERDELVEDMARAENSYIDAGLADLRLKDAQRRVIATLERELDAARESVARVRAALEAGAQALEQACNLLDASPDASDRIAALSCRGFLTGMRAALSAPAPEPSGPDYSGLCSAPSCGGHCGYAHATGCEAIREYLADRGGGPYRAPTREPSERVMRVAEVEALHAVATSFTEAVDAAVRHQERPRGGQQVSFHGDFASAPPSVVGQLKRWARDFSAALAKVS